MIVKKTDINDLLVIKSELKEDNRGHFARVFAYEEFEEHNISFNIKHINKSFNKRNGTIRGMHFQREPFAEEKIIQCIRGSVFDVAIDLRKNSGTFGKYFSIELSEKNRKMIYIPKGFAHGFQTLQDNSELLYIMSERYYPECADGLRWDDENLNIPWPIAKKIISDKDKKLPILHEKKIK